MTDTAQPIFFPADLPSKILWSPTHDCSGAGRLSQASYVLVTPDSPSTGDIKPADSEESTVETKVPDVSTDPERTSVTMQITSGDEVNGDIDIEVVTDDSAAPSNREESHPSDPQDNLVIPSLPDSVLDEMKARVSSKFSYDIQMKSVKAYQTFSDKKEPIVEPLVHVYCHQNGCHEIVDETIKAIAKSENAEVLILDALALSTAESSIFGDRFHETLSALYKDPIRRDDKDKDSDSSDSETPSDGDSDSDDEEVRKRRKERRQRYKEKERRLRKARKQKEKKWEEERKKKDKELQAIFDELVTLQLPQASQDASSSTRKRIIYLRDFGSIASVASPLIVRLLRAIHSRRIALFPEGKGSEDLLQPTLLVLGYAKSTSTNISESVFVRGGDALRKSLPSIGATTFTGDLTSITLSPFASQFFFGSFVAEKDEEEFDYSDDDSFLFPSYGRWRSPPFKASSGPTMQTSYCTIFNGPAFSLESFDLASASLALPISMKVEERQPFAELEKRLCDRRKTDIANTWFRISLVQRKRRLVCDDIVTFLGDNADLQQCLVEDKKEKEKKEKSKSKDKRRKKSKKESEKPKEPRGPYKGQDLLSRLAELTDSSIPIALDQCVNIALGLRNAEQSSEDSTEVPLTAFSKAFQMLIQNHRSRTQWWNEKPKSEDDDEDEDPVVKSVKSAGDLTGHEGGLLSCIVDPNELTTSFDDVCISEKTVETLRTIISLPLKFPKAFKSGVLARESMGGVLLYGPPGTGKTMVCRAVARECGARMLVIKPSDIMDCFVGESEKIVKAIFTLAYRLAPCLIFIDELDAVFGKRKEDDKKWVRDILAEFLQSMDGLKSAKKNKDAGVVLIGATNRPHDIDEAVIRRLPSRMMVDAPEEKQRKRILELHLRGENLDDDVKLDEIASKTTNYSGSDLKNLCVAAAMASVKDAIGVFTWEPIKSKDVPGADSPSKDQSKNETEEVMEKIEKRTVKMKHLIAGMAEAPGSLSSSLTGQSDLQRWHSQYGTGASSRPSNGTGGYSAANRPGGHGNNGAKTGGYGGAGSYGSAGSSTTGAGGHGASGYGSGTGTGGYGSGGHGAGTGKFSAGGGYGAGSASAAFGSNNNGAPGSANGNASTADSAHNANAGTSTPYVPRFSYGGNPGAGLGGTSGYTPSSNAAENGAEGNGNGKKFDLSRITGSSRYGSGVRGENPGSPSASATPRYGGTFGRNGGGAGGGNLSSGTVGGSSFGGGSGNVAGGSLAGLTGGHGIGGYGSGGVKAQEGPHAPTEQVDEEQHDH